MLPKIKSLLMAVALLSIAAAPGTAAPHLLSVLDVSNREKCDDPDASPDDIISVCATMIKMRVAPDFDHGLKAGLAYMRMNQVDNARYYFAIALKVANKRLDEFPDSPEDLNNRCWLEAAVNFDLENGLVDCEKGLKIEPENSDLLVSKALVLYRQDKYRDALAALDVAVRKAPRDPNGWFLRGAVKQKLDISAEADLKAAVELQRNIKSIFRNYGVPVN